MACIKCGKKTRDEQTFCPQCLEAMDDYPVPADVHVQLPVRLPDSGKKPGRKRRGPSPEEQVIALRRKLRRTKLVALLLAAALAGAVFLLIHQHYISSGEKKPDGQNFTVDETLK